MYRVAIALGFGTFALIVRKLGPPMMLFLYITIAHSKLVRDAGPGLFGLSADFWAAILVMILGLVIIVFKTAVDGIAKQFTRRGLTVINQWVLHYVNHDDLTVPALDRKSVAWFTCARTIVLFGFLAMLSLYGIPALGLIVIIVLAIVAAISFTFPQHGNGQQSKSWLAGVFLNHANYSELLMVFGLIIGYMFVISRHEESAIVSGALVLAMARFSGEAGKLAWSIAALRRWHEVDVTARQWRAKRLQQQESQKQETSSQNPPEAKSAA